jgi:lysophospholipase L1-like esterase
VVGVVRQAAAEANACLADLNDAIAPTGIIDPEYTTDGVHFTEKAYTVWASKLNEAVRTCVLPPKNSK